MSLDADKLKSSKFLSQSSFPGANAVQLLSAYLDFS